MRRQLARLDQKGASAIEFALVAPAFFILLFGIAQLGIVFLANAGLSNALAEGARHATIYPRPDQGAIKNKISASSFGLDPANLDVPALSYGVSNSADYADITMTYRVVLNFILFQPQVQLTKSRRVYLQPLPST